MLEGAKLIGAGAATIALAGAAVGIGNVFSSLIHSVARNPSLAKQLFGYAILYIINKRLRNKKKDILRKMDPRENLNSYIQSQTTRKFSLLTLLRRFFLSMSLLLICRPLFRLLIAYFYSVLCQFILGYTPLDISFCNYFSDSLDVHSGSSVHSNSINSVNAPIPEDAPLPNEQPPHNAIPLDVVDQFRMLNFDMELELFARIRLLENRLIEGLPPQMNLGEYEALVREFLDNTLTINHYYNTILTELYDITIMELKANSLDQLFNLLMSETPARLTQILSESPFPERAIRTEALEFITDQLTILNLSDPGTRFEKAVLEHTLRYWLQDLQQNGHRSAFYLHFVEHFTGKNL